MTWLSIITVVRDDPEGLAATLASVAANDRDGVEVLVVDGSADPSIAPGLVGDLGSVIWRQPQGIYPAMNDGLAAASGAYAYYLNAGDLLFDACVLARLRQVLDANRPEWAFGRVEVIGQDGSRVITPPWDYARERAVHFSRGLFPPHQGTVARVDLLRSAGGFDPSYRIAADYALFLRMSQACDPLVLDLVLARFTEGGASTQQWQRSFREFHRARCEILQPSGLPALRERFHTAVHFARVWAYREVILRARR
jgi:glycosyltransferase involved in cell wall biosynthesis